jgi:hypothetical protein
MVEPWMVSEMERVDLKDKRLNKRLTEVLSQLSAHSAASIPAACGGYAEMSAAYRLFDNDKVGFDNVLRPHIEATAQRMSGQKIVILPQDTTEIDLTRPEQEVKGAGPLGVGSRRGVFLHLMHAFTPEGVSLGTVHAMVWSRPEAGGPEKSKRSDRRKQIPIEDKESYRWIEGFRQAGVQARRSRQTRFVSVADSEGDIYELLVEGQHKSANLGWIIRGCYDRALAGQCVNAGEDAETGQVSMQRMHEQIMAKPVLFKQHITVRGRKAKVGCDNRGRRQPRQSRIAEVEVRAGRVKLRPPWRPDRKLPDVSVNVVLVREIDPPGDDVPVEWMLLTNLPIAAVGQVRHVIEYYCVRWMIEIAFRTLKSGCRIQQRRFEDVARFEPCLAVYLIVVWRTLYVCYLARVNPQGSCEAAFEPAEWKAVCQIVRCQPPPSEPPTLSEMVAMTAQLGGYVNRKRDDKPGPQTVWLGLQRVHDMARCWKLFGPETRRKAEKDV